jgi:hypothetical protein
MADAITLLVTASLRVVGICAAAWLITLALRRSSAAARHMVWTCAIVAAPALRLRSPSSMADPATVTLRVTE